MQKLLLAPDANGYTRGEGNQVLRTELDGGVGRYRQDKIGASETIGVKWTLDPAQYQYWMAFYATVTKRGALPFLCDLVSGDGCGPVEYTCNFIPGSVSLASQSGLTYVMQGQLEARQAPRDATMDNSVVLLFETSGGNFDPWFAALEHLCTVTMPSLH